jgi:hypothetical protein
MQRVLFHKSHDIENKQLIIIHADKMSVIKEIIFFSNKTSSFFSSPVLWNPQKQKVTSWCTFINSNIANTRANHLFSKKK